MTALYALLGLAVLLGLVWAFHRDSARQKARRTAVVALAVASRAKTLKECPPEFMTRLREVMELTDDDKVA